MDGNGAASRCASPAGWWAGWRQFFPKSRNSGNPMQHRDQTELPLMEAAHVTKAPGSLTAVDDLSLSVPSGTCFGLLGPNGAGKTTLVKSWRGSLPPRAERSGTGESPGTRRSGSISGSCSSRRRSFPSSRWRRPCRSSGPFTRPRRLWKRSSTSAAWRISGPATTTNFQAASANACSWPWPW